MVVKTKEKDTFNYDEDVYKQIGIIEKDNAKTGTRLDNIESALIAIQRTINEIRDGSRTNWGVLASWATVVVAVMIYHSSLTVQPLADEMLRLRYFKDEMEQNVPSMLVKIDMLRERLEEKTKSRYPREEAEKDIQQIYKIIEAMEKSNAKCVVE